MFCNNLSKNICLEMFTNHYHTTCFQAIQGHFVLSSALFGADDSRIVGEITVAQWKHIYDQMVKHNKIKPSFYASYAYDAVWVFALALDKLLKEDPSRIESIHTDQTTA